MSVSAKHSRWACIFSVRWLFRDASLRELDSTPVPKKCFLWTWTFSDESVRLDPVECGKRWRSMMQDKNFAGRVFVHSFEKAPKTGFWHYHAVTPDWWDVDDMREIAEHHRFGRIDVVAVPVAKAEYVAKYLSKHDPDLPRGMRRWACHGFKGVKAADVEIVKRVDTVPQVDTWEPALWDGTRWTFVDVAIITVLTRSDAVDPLKLKNMEIKPFAQKEILSLIAAGKTVAVGEYRGCVVRSVDVTDKKTMQTTKRLVVEHTVEFGPSSVKIGEWLPIGASEKVTPPADKGQPVLCVVLEISRQYGYKVESIKPLSALV